MPPRGDRAVSHVVAVTLLVAVVVSLAGITAVYLVSFGGTPDDPAPNARLETAFDDRTTANGQYLNITHDGGELVETASLRLDVAGAETDANPPDDAVPRDGAIAAQVGAEWTVIETLSLNRTTFETASGADITGGTHLVLEDATVRLVYAPSRADSTTILYECEVVEPDCSNRES